MDIEQGYSVGFADLEKWSEVDLSRRNYRKTVFAGSVIALIGAVLWPLAAWRNR